MISGKLLWSDKTYPGCDPWSLLVCEPVLVLDSGWAVFCIEF